MMKYLKLFEQDFDDPFGEEIIPMPPRNHENGKMKLIRYQDGVYYILQGINDHTLPVANGETSASHLIFRNSGYDYNSYSDKFVEVDLSRNQNVPDPNSIIKIGYGGDLFNQPGFEGTSSSWRTIRWRDLPQEIKDQIQ